MDGKMFNSYIAQKHADTTFTEKELEAIHTGDVDLIVREFCNMRSERYILQLQCMIKSISLYFRNSLQLKNIVYLNEYKGNCIGCQVMDGDTDIFLGIAGDKDSLLKVASEYAMECFEQLDTDAYDALCELINVINGAYATKLSDEDVEVNMHPPVFYVDTSIKVEKGFYAVTFAIEDKEFQMLMVADTKVNMNK